jgi:uncharacterized Fe-S radical SAM superfamily protein PflX
MAEILGFLQKGSGAIGFVSPSHVIPQLVRIIRALRLSWKELTVVMNTNAYDRKEIIESLEDVGMSICRF